MATGERWTCNATFSIEPPGPGPHALWRGMVQLSRPGNVFHIEWRDEARTFSDVATRLASHVETYLREHGGKGVHD